PWWHHHRPEGRAHPDHLKEKFYPIARVLMSLNQTVLGGSVMKALVLFCAVVLAVVQPAVANAQPAGCNQIVQNLNDSAAAINQDATSYWGHRANFVDLIFGSRSSEPNAMGTAEQEKAQADALRAGTPNRSASFKGLITAAQAQGCLSGSQLSAIVEPTTKSSKRVNFDQFPPEHPIETTVERGPPQMPQ